MDGELTDVIVHLSDIDVAEIAMQETGCEVGILEFT